jgi:hypothetical protein
MDSERNDHAAAARERLVHILPRLAVSSVVFLVAFTAIFSLHRSFAQALVDALIAEAIFVVAVAMFVGSLLVVAMKSRPGDPS